MKSQSVDPNPKALETSAALRMKRLILGHQKAALDHSPCPVNPCGESSESMAFHGPNPSWSLQQWVPPRWLADVTVIGLVLLGKSTPETMVFTIKSGGSCKFSQQTNPMWQEFDSDLQRRLRPRGPSLLNISGWCGIPRMSVLQFVSS